MRIEGINDCTRPSVKGGIQRGEDGCRASRQTERARRTSAGDARGAQTRSSRWRRCHATCTLMGRHAYNRLRCAPADGQARDRPGHVARQHRHRDEDDQQMSKVEFRHGFPIVLNRMICGSHTVRPRGGEAGGVTVTAAPQRQCTRRALRSDYPSLPAQDSWRRRQSMLGESCFEEKASWCTGLD